MEMFGSTPERGRAPIPRREEGPVQRISAVKTLRRMRFPAEFEVGAQEWLGIGVRAILADKLGTIGLLLPPLTSEGQVKIEM